MHSERKQELLHHLVHEHIKTGAPVGSKLLANRTDQQLSPATIRNEMSDLEAEGYITHPHTSAGRIPTAKGWKYYIDNIVQAKTPSTSQQKELQNILKNKKLSYEDGLKSVARSLADMSKNASVIGFSADNVYYTGLSHLFNEPEFEDLQLIRRMSEVIDHMDDVMRNLFTDVEPGVHILVGEDNPFGRECGVILDKFERNGSVHLYGILGPARMHYDKNLGFVAFTNSLLSA